MKIKGKILNFLNRRYINIILYKGRKKKVIDFIMKVKKENEMLLTINEAYQIHMAVKKTQKIKGDLAEVGVYKGGSAKIISSVKKHKKLYLFDTFEGLPEVKEIDKKGGYYKKQYYGPYKFVKESFEEIPGVYIYKGLFPKTAGPIKNKKFSFVNLDVDIYKSTWDCLKFFYPRMQRGGVIMSHDYVASDGSITGVKKAFDEFFKNKLEPIIELSGSQCIIVKT